MLHVSLKGLRGLQGDINIPDGLGEKQFFVHMFKALSSQSIHTTKTYISREGKRDRVRGQRGC